MSGIAQMKRDGNAHHPSLSCTPDMIGIDLQPNAIKF